MHGCVSVPVSVFVHRCVNPRPRALGYRRLNPTLIENHGYGSFKLIQKLHLKCLDNSLNFSLRAENVDIAIGDWYKAGIHGKYLLSASSVKRALQ